MLVNMYICVWQREKSGKTTTTTIAITITKIRKCILFIIVISILMGILDDIYIYI